MPRSNRRSICGPARHGQRPVQAVDDPVLSSPYEEPKEHWVYTDGVPARHRGGVGKLLLHGVPGEGRGAEGPVCRGAARPPAAGQSTARGRQALARGRLSRLVAVTRDLLSHWRTAERFRRLFFCQLEAAETR